jgi:hypothetical protein
VSNTSPARGGNSAAGLTTVLATTRNLWEKWECERLQYKQIIAAGECTADELS